MFIFAISAHHYLFQTPQATDPAALIAGIVLFLIVAAILLALYFLPTIVAIWRNHPNAAPISILNLLLGWCGIGWIVSIIWSLTAIDQNRSYR